MTLFKLQFATCASSNSRTETSSAMLANSDIKFWAFLVSSVYVLGIVSVVVTADTPTDADVRALYSYLLTGYDTRIRPTANQSEAVIVSVHFSLTNILDFQTASQKFDVLGYFVFSWEDEFLTWNSSQYSGVSVMKIPKTQVWTPTIMISKIYLGESKVGHDSERVAVTSSGTVLWQPEGTYRIICEVKISYYPFDQQTCILTFYVSDESKQEVELMEDAFGGIRTDKFSENSEWKLLEVYAERKLEYGTYIMDINLKLGRRFEFILFTVIAPLIILSVLNLCVFLVPIESEEKGSFSVTIFLSYGVFVSEISSSLPHNSLDLPYLLIYMLLLLIFSVMTVIYAIIQSRIFTLKAEQPVEFSFCGGRCNKRRVTPIQNAHVNSMAGVDTNPGGKIHAPRYDPIVEPGQQKIPVLAVTEFDTRTGINESIPVPEYDPPKKPAQGQMTWREFLRKIDFLAFSIFLVTILFCTSYFFYSMINSRAIY